MSQLHSPTRPSHLEAARLRSWLPLAFFIALMSLPGCATLAPVFDPDTTSESALTLRATTAVGDRLSLTLHAPDAHPGDQLIVVATHLDEPLTDTALDEPQARAINHGLLTIEQVLGDQTGTWEFEASLVPDDDQKPTHRDALTLHWPGPLAAPTMTLDHRERGIAIAWTPASQSPQGVIIARRDILADGPFLPLAALPPSERTDFFDPHVDSDGVYAYRLQAWERIHGFERRSEPSDDLFIAP